VTEKHGAEAATVASRLGWDSGLEILEANEPTLRRGHHLALVATEGSGVEAVYAFAVLQACEAESGDIQALVLCSTDERAGRVARALQAGVGPDGFNVFLAGHGWQGSEPVSTPSQVVVSRPSRVLPAIRSGIVGLGSLRLLILDGAAGLTQLDEWSSVEPILDTPGPDVRKIVSTGRPDSEFRELIERQLPRARRWPEDLLPISGSEDTPAVAGPAVRVAVGEVSDSLALLESCVAAAEESSKNSIVVQFVDTSETGAGTAALAVLGRQVSVDGSTARVERGDPGQAHGAAILFGTPARLAEFESAFEGAEQRYAVVQPRHLSHFEALARRAGFEIHHFGGALLTDPLDAVALYRRRLEEAVRSVDFVPELLVLEPLIERFGAVRLAAALSGLLRRRDEAPGTVVPWPDIEAASLSMPSPSPGMSGEGRAPSIRQSTEPPRGARTAWTKLFFGIGRKDDIKPGDLVGAITGETGIVGGQIGKIDIRGGFTLVEIDSQVVDEVVRKLAGVTIRGQEVPVRPDRER
jgi:ATP-dependent RNA helicase DeaD